MDGHFVQCRRIAEKTLAFTIELDEPLAFRAGQSCDVILKSPPYDDAKGATRTFTIASAPSEDPRLTFATRDTGSAFKRSIAEAPAGLSVEVEGPWGDFVLHDDPSRPAVMLAGGIGITPFRSIIADAVERRLPHSITLVYSNRSAASAAFLDELLAWERLHPALRVVPSFTGGLPAADARAGRITPEWLRSHVTGDGRAIYYAAGTEPFVLAMRDGLRSLGVGDEAVRLDEFPGY